MGCRWSWFSGCSGSHLLLCPKTIRFFEKSLSAKRLLSEATGSSTVPLFPYKDIERATNGFSEKQRLGTGAYGTVYAGKLHNDEWVAIKKLRRHDADGIEQIMNEIKLLSSVSHQNLVRLLGCCIEKGEQILVYEFMPNGIHAPCSPLVHEVTASRNWMGLAKFNHCSSCGSFGFTVYTMH